MSGAVEIPHACLIPASSGKIDGALDITMGAAKEAEEAEEAGERKEEEERGGWGGGRSARGGGMRGIRLPRFARPLTPSGSLDSAASSTAG